MNLALAILSFFAAVFLPGAVLYKIFFKKFHIDFCISSFLAISFIFSLCFNFYLVYILVYFGIYTQQVVVGIFAIEILLFLACFFREITSGIKTPNILKSNDSALKVLFFLGVLISLYLLASLLKGQIFTSWDAVASWNRWGIEWARGDFVLNEGGYPQIYPMLLSLGYVASAKIASFQAIGVAIYKYFAFVGIIACIFLFFKDSLKNAIFGFVLSALIWLVFVRLSGEFYIGYVDLPVAMVILIAMLFLTKASFLLEEASAGKEIDLGSINFYLIFGAIAAGISAEIKQAGLFCCVVYLAGLLYLRFLHPKKVNFKTIVICFFAILFFCAPWVIIAIYKKLYLNTDATNLSYTMEAIYDGKGRLERLYIAIKHHKFYTILFLVSLLALKLKNKILAFLAIFGFLYFIFWGMNLSYDDRNLQAGLPLMIVALGAVIVYFVPSIQKIFLNKFLQLYLFAYKKIALIFVGFVAIGLIVAPFNQNAVLKSEEKRSAFVDAPFFNSMVANTFEKKGKKYVIFNNKLLRLKWIDDNYKFYNFLDFSSQDELLEYANKLKHKYDGVYVVLAKSELDKYRDFVNMASKIRDSREYSIFEYK
ncbi:hypothetical protein [Helicobacter sp. 11S02596-1]|uniref:hypothetical protein n=1 Tax=Helicobacter sp. 11S02596-1 TaxID=1476194 RepID=UPI000BA716F0|nr:hypothetical protein [Helicobacter sp. 11S02596-1]PAF42126.1 hypothetical protein BJI48_07400 [Helicobacter sp. 11S02596-1]